MREECGEVGEGVRCVEVVTLSDVLKRRGEIYVGGDVDKYGEYLPNCPSTPLGDERTVGRDLPYVSIENTSLPECSRPRFTSP